MATGLGELKSKIKIAIKGKNVNRFLFKLYKKKINILDVNKINNNEMYIWIYFHDYDVVVKLNTIYEIFIVEYGGMIRRKKEVNKNKFILIFIVISLVVVFIFSKLIFNIEIITNDSKMRDKLLYELSLYNIERYQFQKSYKEIQSIKEKILSKYKNEIEWLEIELVGTNYIVKYEPRIIETKEEKTSPRNIVAKKNAIIYSVTSSKGQILKNKNEYVQKGDIIVSGNIFLNDEIKAVVGANGYVLGEVWYEVDVFYPYAYYEQRKTGRTKDVYVVNFLNHRIELFNFEPFYDKIIKDKVIIKNEILPFNLSKEKQIEVNTISSIKTEEIVYLDAITLAITKMENKLDDNEFIKDYKVIDKKLTSKGIELTIFISAIENITEYEEIGDVDDEKHNH